MHCLAPFVSCIVPVHNGAAFIAQALQSILAQAGARLEIIVIDDGSHDDSARIAQGFDGVHVHRQAQRGVAAARNAGVALARGDYVAFLDVDDLWLPGKLAAQLAALAGDPDADYSLTLVRHVRTDPDGTLPEGDDIGEVKLGQLMQCMLARRRAFDKLEPLDETLRSWADQDWFLRADHQGLKRLVVEQILTIRRIHGGNVSLRQAGQSRLDFIMAAKLHLNRKRQAGGI